SDRWSRFTYGPKSFPDGIREMQSVFRKLDEKRKRTRNFEPRAEYPYIYRQILDIAHRQKSKKEASPHRHDETNRFYDAVIQSSRGTDTVNDINRIYLEPVKADILNYQIPIIDDDVK